MAELNTILHQVRLLYCTVSGWETSTYGRYGSPSVARMNFGIQDKSSTLLGSRSVQASRLLVGVEKKAALARCTTRREQGLIAAKLQEVFGQLGVVADCCCCCC